MGPAEGVVERLDPRAAVVRETNVTPLQWDPGKGRYGTRDSENSALSGDFLWAPLGTFSASTGSVMDIYSCRAYYRVRLAKLQTPSGFSRIGQPARV